MDEKGFDGLLLTLVDNVRYVTQFDRPLHSALGRAATGQYTAVLPREGESILYIPQTQYVVNPKFIHERNPWISDVRLLRDWINSGDYEKWSQDLEKGLRDRDLTNKVLGVDFMSFQALEKLKRSLPNAEIKSVYGEMHETRAIKSRDEIRLMRMSCEIVQLGVEAAMKLISNGVKECKLAAAVAREVYAAGAEALAFNPYTRGGKDSVPRYFATERRLSYGDVVNIDAGCIYGGYCSDIHRSTVVGRPTIAQKEAYRALYEAYMEMIKKVFRAGVSVSDIINRWYEILESNYSAHSEPYGHMIGLSTVDGPYIFGRHCKDFTYKSGMVFCFEPRIGSLELSAEMGGFFRIEDEFVITENGVDMISNLPYEEKLLS